MNGVLTADYFHHSTNYPNTPSCVYCDGGWGHVVEHVRPKSWPGPSTEFVPSCHRCNVDKHSNDPVTWFFLLVRRDGAVIGREETLADRRATLILNKWGDEIRAFVSSVTDVIEAPS